VDGSVIAALGQDPENGEGPGWIYRIDASKRGDVSPELPDAANRKKGVKNPNSAAMWGRGGAVQKDGEKKLLFRRSLSAVAVHDGLVYAADLSGYLHCLDFKSGEEYWEADLMSAVWGAPTVADGKVFLGDEDGELEIFAAGKQAEADKTRMPIKKVSFGNAIYGGPVFANGRLYVATRNMLYAFKIQD
ncbi:MAG TPA: PQQ-binding-like beta-propeller repeat protein, partial [Planctomycetia bacterium]|nr:PQQ-binding-like beta-propeller repeat protein [Planctomycetia bacterium]